MLAFTDGIDNASQFRDKKIYTSKQAYEYTKNKILNTSIKDNTIETYIIGARGIDLKTSEQAAKFQAELKGLIPDGHLSDRFTYLENMQNLENTFENIADGLAKGGRISTVTLLWHMKGESAGLWAILSHHRYMSLQNRK